jgi:hypothetical protein
MFLSSCGKQTPQSIQHNKLQAQLGQAKHFDIPIPLTFTLAESNTKQQPNAYNDYMRYNGSLSVAQTSSFFKKEMELAGWDIVDLSNSNEGFLYCMKPTKQCGIEIRPSGKPQKRETTTICLFVTQKT